MKRSPQVKIYERDEYSSFMGFSLKADFVAEHEWGISPMKKAFNIPSCSSKEHAENKTKNLWNQLFYKIPFDLKPSSNSNNLYIVETKDIIYLCSSKSISDKDWSIDYLERKAYFSKDENISGAWDSESFVISMENTIENKNYFNDLILAEKRNDLVIGYFPSLCKDGIFVGIYHLLPSQVFSDFKEEMERNTSLFLDMKKSGIEKLLQTKGKRYFALTPKRKEDGSLSFWLNPTEQSSYNHGWYSLEELKLWAEEKGPIIKQKG